MLEQATIQTPDCACSTHSPTTPPAQCVLHFCLGCSVRVFACMCGGNPLSHLACFLVVCAWLLGSLVCPPSGLLRQ